MSRRRAESIDLIVSGFHKYPPFKTIGTCGIRPGGLPRWLELLTKLAAILDLETQSRLTRTPPPARWYLLFSCQDGQSAQNPPGVSNGQHLPGGYQYRWPIRDQVGPGGPRWLF